MMPSAIGFSVSGAEHRPHEGEHVHHHQLRHAGRMPRGEHHAHRPAHRMTDHGDGAQLLLGNVARNLFRHRRGDIAFGVAVLAGPGKAMDLHLVPAIAGDRGDHLLPHPRRGG